MSSSRWIWLKKQTGHLTLDADACYNEMKDICAELYEQHYRYPTTKHMFRQNEKGEIELWEDGADYGGQGQWNKCVNVWGFSDEGILQILAKHLKGRGRLIFITQPEGNPGNCYFVTAGRCKKIA